MRSKRWGHGWVDDQRSAGPVSRRTQRFINSNLPHISDSPWIDCLVWKTRLLFSTPNLVFVWDSPFDRVVKHPCCCCSLIFDRENNLCICAVSRMSTKIINIFLDAMPSEDVPAHSFERDVFSYAGASTGKLYWRLANALKSVDCYRDINMLWLRSQQLYSGGLTARNHRSCSDGSSWQDFDTCTCNYV